MRFFYDEFLIIKMSENNNTPVDTTNHSDAPQPKEWLHTIIVDNKHSHVDCVLRSLEFINYSS